jgi:hypothetical protein
MTTFLGCGFAAKYREGGGNLSVPLQWMLGLRRLKRNAIWLELLPASGNPREDKAKIDNFQRRMREHGLAGRYCLLHQTPAGDEHDLDAMRCIGISKRELLNRLAGPNTLLNLSYSIHPPFLLRFEHRILCDLDPGEIFFWMTRLEMGQSHHHEFWTIGLNANGGDCRLPKTVVPPVPAASQAKRPPLQGLTWKTFYPLADTKLYRPRPRPRNSKFTTIGQWYWDGAIEVDGRYPDMSKKAAFEKYLDLPQRVPAAMFELAMNMNAEDPERARVQNCGWQIIDPHRVARTPRAYRQYLASAVGEFTAIKGVDVVWRTGWISDRAAAFLAMGRPVITEDTGAGKYLPDKSGFRFVKDAAQAEIAVREVLRDWKRLSAEARRCAIEVFDSAKNLRKILLS